MSVQEISSWYTEKIIERIQKNKLLEKEGVFLWQEAASEIKQSIGNRIPISDEFIVVFWKNENCWTLLSSVYLFSYYKHKITKIKLTEIKGEFEIDKTDSMNQIETKTQSEFLVFPKLKNQKIWFPPGATIFGVMNTLLYVTKKYTKRPLVA